MRRLLSHLAEALFALTGTGAVANARQEVRMAEMSVVDLDTRLRHVARPSPPRAA